MLKLFAATISIFFSIAVLIPIIPQYVHSILKANDFAVGVVMAMQAIGAISSRMIVGKIISTYGTRKAMVLGASISTIGGLTYFLPSCLLILSLARLLQGVGEGFVFTAGTTWVLNIAPQDSRGRYIALFGLALWLGGTFAPPLGDAVTTHFGFNGAWVFATVAAALGVIILTFWTRQEHKVCPEKTRLEWIAKEALRPGITLGLASAGYVAIATFGTLFFSSKGWAGRSFPIAAFGMGFVVMRLFGGYVLDHTSVKVVARYSTMLEAIGLLGMSFASSSYIAIGSSFITGLGLALMYPALAVAAVDGVKLHRQGTVIGWYTAFWDLSLFSSNIIFGWIACSMGYRAVFMGGFAFTILALLYISSWKNPIKNLSKNDEGFESIQHA